MLKVKGNEIFSDLGDGPAQAVLQDNSRARALRQAAETQEELAIINERVSRTIDAYELQELLAPRVEESEVERIAEDYLRDEANLEFIDDMTQLMVILSDPVAKRKYQQQVTVFIVGFENLCGRRARLLAQLQEFFIQNSLEDDRFELEPPEFDIEDVGKQVSEALGKAENATKRLAVISKDVIKALEVANPKESKKGKKKLEKAIQQSQHDIISLTEKLMKVQHELADSEGKMTQMYKSMEMKQVEIERLKVQVDNGKKAVENLKEVKAEMAMKDEELQRTNKVINDLELSVGHLEDKQGRDYERQRVKREENQKVKEDLEEKVRDQQQFIAELRSDLQKQYDSKLKDLVEKHEKEVIQMKGNHQGEIYRTHKAMETIKKKNEELKTEMSNLSKRNSLSVSTGTNSKRGSLFSPDSSEGENSSRRASFKSSAQAVKMMVGKKSDTDRTSSGIGSASQTPQAKTSSDSDSSLPRDASQGGTQPPPSVTRSDSKIQKEKSEMKEVVKSKPKSPEKKTKGKSEKSAGEAAAKSGNSAGNVDSAESKAPVMVDVGVQIEGDELSEERARLLRRKSSILEVVPEEKEQEEEVEEEPTELDLLGKDELLKKMEEYKSKSQEKQQKLQEELTELKNKYVIKTNSLKQHIEDSSNHFAKEKDELLRQAKEAEMLKHQAEKEAEQAMLQLEEMLAEQEELRKALNERTQLDKREANTMTGLSLLERDDEADSAAVERREQQTSTSLSLVSRREEQTMTSASLDGDQGLVSESNHSLGSQASLKASAQREGTGIEEPAEGDLGDVRTLSPRDSGFEGTGSSRPSTSTVNVLSPKVEVEEVPQTPNNVPAPATRSGSLSIPDRRAMVMSARARKRLVNSALQENPVAEETVRTYEAVLKFKEKAADWLQRQELREDATVLTEIKTVMLNKEDKMQVIESLPLVRGSIIEVLGTFNEILSPKLLASETEKPPIASEFRTRGESTPVELVEGSGTRARPAGRSAESHESGTRTAWEDKTKIEGSYAKLLKEHNDLTESFERLRQHLDEETKFHQEQTSQNAAVMAEMQDTINQLKEQLEDALLGRSSSSGRASSSIMFTRLDAERNAKIMKRATNEERLSQDSYSELMSYMEEYVSLPAKRLVHIVRRYSHHCAMKEIEESLKQSSSLDGNVFGALEKMEVLQNQRARRWGDRMDQLASERDRLARLMTSTFEKMEQNTGIFLIKPVYSYKARSADSRGHPNMKQKSNSLSHFAQPSGPATPAPTPWQRRISKTPLSVSEVPQGPSQGGVSARVSSSIPSLGQLENGAMFMKVTQPGKESTEGLSVGPVWQASRSQVLGTPPSSVPLTSPRILELDVNRALIGHNQVSAEIHADKVRENASSAVRSYVTVERPYGGKQMRKAKRYTTSGYDYSGAQSPPNTPLDSKIPRGHSSSSLVQFSPLPPIRMPELPEESRSTKSIRSYPESEALTQSIPGSPFSIARLDEQRPNTQETSGKRVLSPDTIPVR